MVSVETFEDALVEIESLRSELATLRDDVCRMRLSRDNFKRLFEDRSETLRMANAETDRLTADLQRMTEERDRLNKAFDRAVSLLGKKQSDAEFWDAMESRGNKS